MDQLKTKAKAKTKPEIKPKGVLFAQTADEIRSSDTGDKIIVKMDEYESDSSLSKSIANYTSSSSGVNRISFEVDPLNLPKYQGLYVPKRLGVPFSLQKQVAREDTLVSNIVRARSNHVSQFGAIKKDRFSKGYDIVPQKGVLDRLDLDGKKKLIMQISSAMSTLATCGKTTGVKETDKKSFSQYLQTLVASGVVCGSFATEILYTTHPLSKERTFHRFVSVDSGTIYQAADTGFAVGSVRESALKLLENISGKKLDQEENQPKTYSWVQVIENTPRQAFTDSELKYYNLYPIPDIEAQKYPWTPIDTVISSITTHLNIGTHNKLYFSSGRATRGMLIIKSDDILPQNLNQIKQQFNANINNASNSWRMPVFSCPTEGDIEWKTLDTGASKDMEFQYLTDMNAREILTAFMMSPEELPGWAYLSKGTSSQTMSESNNEYKLEAARDVGIRPLLGAIEDYINNQILPVIDADLASKTKFIFCGLDAKVLDTETAELAAAASLWMSFNGILEKTEKPLVKKELCGDMPLNPVFKSMLDSYLTVGQVLEGFCGVEGASKLPELQYRRDQFWFQQQQILLAKEQLKAQVSQPQPSVPDQPNPSDPNPTPDAPSPPKGSGNGDHPPTQSDPSELGKNIDQAFQLLSKADESTLPVAQRKILMQHRKAVDSLLSSFKKDSEEAVNEILGLAEKIKNE